MPKTNYQKGIIKTIVIVLIGIVFLSYFGIDLEQATKSDLLRKNLSYSWEVVKSTWNNYIVGSVDRVVTSVKNVGSKETRTREI